MRKLILFFCLIPSACYAQTFGTRVTSYWDTGAHAVHPEIKFTQPGPPQGALTWNCDISETGAGGWDWHGSYLQTPIIGVHLDYGSDDRPDNGVHFTRLGEFGGPYTTITHAYPSDETLDELVEVYYIGWGRNSWGQYDTDHISINHQVSTGQLIQGESIILNYRGWWLDANYNPVSQPENIDQRWHAPATKETAFSWYVDLSARPANGRHYTIDVERHNFLNGIPFGPVEIEASYTIERP